jgi:2-oxoglutarate ferredoxin oxidoreductase subunit alpha
MVDGPEQADLLVLSWGGTRGVVSSAVSNCRERGQSVAHAHLRYLNPFPRNLGTVLSRYSRVLVPELNGGQLALLLRARHAIETISFSKIQGRPFGIAEVETKVEEALA